MIFHVCGPAPGIGGILFSSINLSTSFQSGPQRATFLGVTRPGFLPADRLFLRKPNASKEAVRKARMVKRNNSAFIALGFSFLKLRIPGKIKSGKWEFYIKPHLPLTIHYST